MPAEFRTKHQAGSMWQPTSTADHARACTATVANAAMHTILMGMGINGFLALDGAVRGKLGAAGSRLGWAVLSSASSTTGLALSGVLAFTVPNAAVQVALGPKESLLGNGLGAAAGGASAAAALHGARTAGLWRGTLPEVAAPASLRMAASRCGAFGLLCGGLMMLATSHKSLPLLPPPAR